MEALFLKLVNMSISASWLVLAVVVLRILMKKAPKWMTCALWAMVAIRLVFPFSIESMFSVIPDPEPIPPSVITNHTPIVAPADTPIASDTPVVSPGIPMPGTQADAITPAGITELAATVWIVGVAVLLIYALVSYLLIRRKVSASLRLRENIYLCDYIESPFILGILRPRIYLPSSLDQSQWPHVLAHEQAHLHRRDHWWKPLGFSILCVYWFNPVLWLAYILLCRDIELACDERVIRDMDTRQKQDYTTALLECSMPRYLVAACPLAFGEVGVKERVKSVLNYKKPAFWIILIALVLCIAAAVCFLTDPVGESTITPGTYNIANRIYGTDQWNEWNGNKYPYIADGQYILHNNTLYHDGVDGMIAVGNMQEYDLSNTELHSYLRNDDWWHTFFHHIPTISETLWLRMEDGTFYVWFQTTNGETYLGCGVEDYGERYEGASDDTFISHLRRLTRDETAEEKELAWFDATVLEAQATLLRVAPVYGSWEAEQYGELEVSRYYIIPDTEMCGLTLMPGEFTVGDRVRIVYDGQIQETYPARINKTYSTINRPAEELNYVAYNSINEAILDGCVAMVNGDAVVGQEQWKNFVETTQSGLPDSIRLVEYNTLTTPDNYDPSNFQDVFQDYPVLTVHDLAFDGTGYTLRSYSGGTVRESSWDYMTQYSQVNWGNQNYTNYFVLANMPDLSWEDYTGSIAVSFTPIRSRPVYFDVAYEHTPTLAELEAAKTSLEPYMIEYKINLLDANELTHRLDVGVSEWVDGLEDLIEQFVDWKFVTVTYQEEGSFVLTDRNDIYTRFPDYFGLSTFKGLELYAFEDGYVLMSGTNRLKTEDEINALPRATEEEMKKILESYQAQIEYQNIFIDNRTIRTERDIRIKLGIAPFVEASMNVINATSTEGLVEYQFTIPVGCQGVWVGYAYSLEVLTDEGWVHYGYPPDELAWPAALLFYYETNGNEPITATEVFDVQWSTTTGGPLPPGTYRYCQSVTIYYDGDDLQFQTMRGIFEVPADSPEDPGVHMEILNPTDTGATLAITYNGGLMGELSTQGKYYLMVDVGGGMTRYGLSPGQVTWGDGLYMLNEGETVFIDVRWDHTADAPLPVGTYYVVLTVDQNVPDNGAVFQFQKYITESFAITD